MKIFAFVAPFSVVALPVAVAGQQDDGAHYFSTTTLGRDTLTDILSDVKSGRASVDPSRNLRHLEFTEACNNTYNELWTDQALSDAYDTYSENLDAVVDATSTEEGCTENGGNSVVCDLNIPVEGEEDFRSSCSSAGGAIDFVRLDIFCSLTLDGEEATIFYDMPDALDCVPTGSEFEECKDSLLDTFDIILQFLEETIEEVYVAAGFTNVNCDVGAVSSSSATFSSMWPTGVAAAAVVGALLLS